MLGADHARRGGIDFQLAAQPHNLDVNTAIENVFVGARGLEQLFARQGALRCLKERQQQRVFAPSERNLNSAGVNKTATAPFKLPALEAVSAALRTARPSNPPNFLPPQHGQRLLSPARSRSRRCAISSSIEGLDDLAAADAVRRLPGIYPAACFT